MSEHGTIVATKDVRAIAAPQHPWERYNLTREKWEVIRKMCCTGAPDDVMELYLERCKAYGCDPFERMFYVVPRNANKKDAQGNWHSETQWTMQSSIDLLRSLANSEPGNDYAGQIGPLWTADGEKWVDVWLSDKPPVAVKIGVLRHSFKEPMWVTATLAYYRPSSPSGFWSNDKAAFQLAKCCEALALRKAFPKRLHGLYADAEMDQDARQQRAQAPEAAPAAANDAPATVVASGVTPPPANPLQAVLAKRAAEKADTPEARAAGIAAIVELYEKHGQKAPDPSFYANMTREQLVGIFRETKAALEPPAGPDAPDGTDGRPAEQTAPEGRETAQEAVFRVVAPSAGGPPMSEQVKKKLFAMLGTAGVRDKDERARWARGFGGGLADLDSFADLSWAQASFLIDRLSEAAAAFAVPSNMVRGKEPCVACGAFEGTQHAARCPESDLYEGAS